MNGMKFFQKVYSDTFNFFSFILKYVLWSTKETFVFSSDSEE